MFTHICIQDPDPNTASDEARKKGWKIKKRDYLTLKEEYPHLCINGAYEFYEDEGLGYDRSLFLPLPPQKTVYVEIAEEVKKETKQPCLN